MKAPADRPTVLLYPDTFTNFFDPEIGSAAVEVLESAGFRVELPRRLLCCGRPLYDHGFLGLAKKLLRQNLDALREPLRRGMPVVILEPSCLATFRDELPGLFADDADAQLLRENVVSLAELLQQPTTLWQPPKLHGKAVLHGHCHQKALWGLSAELNVLAKTGLDVTLLDSGCCGLAGSFGFDARHHDVSMACGELMLLPAVRAITDDTAVVTDGFSCRNQIDHGARRRAVHLAQLLTSDNALHQVR